MNPVVSSQSSLLSLSSLRLPEHYTIAHQETYEIGCTSGLHQAFKRIIDAGQLARPELPLLVVSGLPGAGKSTTAEALSRFLESKEIAHQVIPMDMFVSRHTLRHLAFAGAIAAQTATKPLFTRPLRCAIGRGSLRVLHEFESITELLDRLSTLNLPHTIQPSIHKYGARELVPGRLTIIEGYAASLMMRSLPGAVHCFIDAPLQTARSQYLQRHADDPSQSQRASIRSMFFHSATVQELIESQRPLSNFALRYAPGFDLRRALA
jgi:DNA polymerase III delta prime subunit